MRKQANFWLFTLSIVLPLSFLHLLPYQDAALNMQTWTILHTLIPVFSCSILLVAKLLFIHFLPQIFLPRHVEIDPCVTFMFCHAVNECDMLRIFLGTVDLISNSVVLCHMVNVHRQECYPVFFFPAILSMGSFLSYPQ